MRVRVAKMLARAGRGERGAVVVIVALMLIALLTMVVLTVDVGGLLIKRRVLVKATDSGTLAAAQSCATEKPLEALVQADLLAKSNVDGARRTAQEHENCDADRSTSSGSITLRYADFRRMYFAPVLGFPRQARLSATATAIWGAAGGGQVVPIELTVNPANEIPCVLNEPGTQCGYWYDQDNNDFDSSSNWGFMNLSQWDVAPEAPCPNAGAAERRDQIVNGAQVSLARIPTLVCVDGGAATNLWIDTLQSQIGKTKDFPINDPDQMIRTSGKEKYAIVGFARFKLADVIRGNRYDYGTPAVPAQTGSCADITRDFNPTPSETSYDLTADMTSCQVTNAADRILEPPVVEKGSRTFVEGTHYDYDEATDVITWTDFSVRRQDRQNVKIKFRWERDEVAPLPAGPCGPREFDANAVCVVLEYPGLRVGGTNPGGGADFGLRAIRLSE